MKNKKVYTLLLVGPNGRPWKIRVPRIAIYVLLMLALGGAVGLTALAKSYARMLLKVSNYNYLRADRDTLKTNYHSLEATVKHTNTQLRSLESLASEVAASYGFGGTTRVEAAPVSLAFVEPGSDPADASYNASLYAFNRIEEAATEPSRSAWLAGLLSSNRALPADIPAIWPVQGEVTDGFGERVDPFSGMDSFHPGVDIAAPAGTPVRATADGIVLEAGREDAGYGNEVLIDHGYGISTRYGHLRRIFVVDGQQVKQGQIIGSVGMTGRATGPHLHYEVLVHQTPVNPSKFLRG